jgi:hypothetical protein
MRTGVAQTDTSAGSEEPLSAIERAVVAALVSAIVKELRADQPQPVRRPAAGV